MDREVKLLGRVELMVSSIPREQLVPTFEIKQIQVPLFGVVEAAHQAAWLSAFSATARPTPVQIDDAALDIIAEELELDAEGLAADAERYVNGIYRAKARGMGGSCTAERSASLRRVPPVGHEKRWRSGALVRP